MLLNHILFDNKLPAVVADIVTVAVGNAVAVDIAIVIQTQNVEFKIKTYLPLFSI